MPHVATFGLGWKIQLLRRLGEIFERNGRRVDFKFLRRPFIHEIRFELAVQEQDHSPASCGLRGAAHDRALDQFQAACAAVGIVNRFTTLDGNKRAPGFHDLFSLYR
jgi:hypothetical protein